MFSLVVTLLAISLVTLLVLAATYYGFAAYERAVVRASAAKVISQSSQVLGAAELFYVEHERWPRGVDELIEKRYLRERPIYLAGTTNDAAKAAILSNWVSSAYASEALVNKETVPEITWSAPVPLRPTYWVLRSTDESICRAVNLASRGDNGVYEGIVPGLVTQCFGLSSPYTVVTTRDASSAYFDMLISEWNGDEDIKVSKDFKWTIEPTELKQTYQPNPFVLNLPDEGSLSGAYLGGRLHLGYSGQGTNSVDLGTGGPGIVSLYNSGNAPFWVESIGSSGGFTVTSNCQDGALEPGVMCTLTITPPSNPDAIQCSTQKGIIEIQTSSGKVLADVSAMVCPSASISAPGTSVAGLTHPMDSGVQWWFRDTHVGEYGTKTVQISNTGTAPLGTTTASIAAKAPFSIASNQCPDQLWPGQACLIQLNFTPSRNELYAENKYPFILQSVEGPKTFYLNGRGLPEKVTGVSVYPNPLTLSPVYDGGHYQGTVTIHNYGTTVQYLDKAPLLQSDNDAYSIRASNCSSSGLGGRSACYVSLNFSPVAMGKHPATLTVSLDELGTELVQIEANVQSPFKLESGTLPLAYVMGAYSTKDLSSNARVLNGTPIDYSKLELSLSGLPSGLSFNSQTFKIEGRLAADVAPGDYPLNLKGKYGKYSADAVLRLPVHEASSAEWFTSIKLETPNAVVNRPTEDLTARASALTQYAYLGTDMIGIAGNATGVFNLKGNNPYLFIRAVYGISADNTLYGCGARVETNGVTASSCTSLQEGTKGLAVELVLPTVASRPVTGNLSAALHFSPSEKSTMQPPEGPFVFNVDSAYGQTAVMTTGRGSTASAATSTYDFGTTPVGSGFVYEKDIFIRGSTKFGRLGGSWKLEGDSNFKLLHSGTASSTTAVTLECLNRSYSLVNCVARYHPANDTGSDLFVRVQYRSLEGAPTGTTPTNAVLTWVPHSDYPVEPLAPLTMKLTGATISGQTVALTRGLDSTAAGAITAPQNFGQLPVGSGKTSDRSFFIRAGTLNNRIAGTWKLEGDPSFSLVIGGSARRNSSDAYTYSCATGSTSIRYCLAKDHPALNTDSDLKITVRYSALTKADTGVTPANAVLTWTPDPNYPVEALTPLSVELTASTISGQTVALTRGLDSTAAGAITAPQNFGQLPVGSGKTSDRSFFIRAGTLNNRIAGTWKLEGDPSFSLVIGGSARRNSSDAYTYPCATGSTSIRYCLAKDHPALHTDSDLKITVRYTALRNAQAGDSISNAVLTWTPDPNYPVEALTPLSINLKGTSL